MSNILYVTVGNFIPLDQPESVNIVVLAQDSYGRDAMTFDDTDHLLNCYPTKEDLVAGIVQLPAFNGVASLKADGTYELDAASSVIVQGFPQ